MVFEDAHVGVEAGLAGGFTVVVVAEIHRAETLEAAHRVVDRLDALSVGDLHELIDRVASEPN